MTKKRLLIGMVLVSFVAFSYFVNRQNISMESSTMFKEPSTNLSKKSTKTEAISEPIHQTPPNQLIFFSQAELETFINAVNMPDADLLDFLDQNNYSMNGVSTKEELVNLSQMITSTPFPTVGNLVPSDITVFVESKMLHIRYESPSGEVYSFKYSIQKDSATVKQQVKNEESNSEVVEIPISRSDFQLYEISGDAVTTIESSIDVHPYIIQSDRPVSLRMFNIDPASIKDYVEDIVFMDLSTKTVTK